MENQVLSMSCPLTPLKRTKLYIGMCICVRACAWCVCACKLLLYKVFLFVFKGVRGTESINIRGKRWS